MWEKAFSEAESHTPNEAVQRGRGHSSLRFAAKFNLGHHCIGLVKAWDHVTGSLPLDCRAWHDPGPAGHQEEHLNLYQSDRSKAVPSGCLDSMRGAGRHLRGLLSPASGTEGYFRSSHVLANLPIFTACKQG